MTRGITHSISVRREGDRVLLEDKEIEHGRGSLLRVTILDSEAALELGREMVRLGLEAARDPSIGAAKSLALAEHADPYPEASQ